MTPLTCDLFLSLDGFGFGEGYGPYFGYGGPELQGWIDAEMAVRQRILMGRKTFEALLQYGGTADEAMTGMPKLVATRRGFDTSGWKNSTELKGEVVESIANLKKNTGPPIRSFGSPSVVRALFEAGLVDNLRLLIFPVVLGANGREPFFESMKESPLALLGTQTLDGRLVLMEYGPARA